MTDFLPDERETILEDAVERRETLRNEYPRYDEEADGAGGGAVVGAVVGALVAGPVGALVGGALGAAAGGTAGAVDQTRADHADVGTGDEHAS